MPSLKDIRRRINSVKNTQKITRAMKLVAAAKFARANTAVVSSRPYGQAFDAMVAKLISAAGQDFESPLLTTSEEKKSLVVILATDRGFCGSLNANLYKHVLHFISGKRKNNVEIEVVPWGRRAQHFTQKLSYRSVGAREKVSEKPNYELAKELADGLIDRFTSENFDRVYIGYMKFRSALSQAPHVVQVLPVGNLEGEGGAAPEKESDVSQEEGASNMIIEPDVNTVLDGLLKRAVASVVFRCMLEAAASEHGARMTAMDSATNNAHEVNRKLTIQYNRARQAAITKELIEITSGAEAL